MSYRHALLAAVCLVVGVMTPSFADEQAIRVSASAKAACMPDAVRLCRDAIPNVQNVLIGFGQHRDKINPRCLTVLASYGIQ